MSTMLDHIKSILTGQFEAALCMLNDCIELCPQQHWDGVIAKYPFWQVAYHTLCFADLYLSPGEQAFELSPILHPNGWNELNDEYPSRRFEKPELAPYVAHCRRKMLRTIAGEAQQSLEGPSGFPRLPFARSELYIYTLRHVQHHTGQLGAFLRRLNVSLDPRWVKSGWR